MRKIDAWLFLFSSSREEVGKLKEDRNEIPDTSNEHEADLKKDQVQGALTDEESSVLQITATS